VGKGTNGDKTIMLAKFTTGDPKPQKLEKQDMVMIVT
jgi:hypothetical protein